jgi:hypothetical protein
VVELPEIVIVPVAQVIVPLLLADALGIAVLVVTAVLAVLEQPLAGSVIVTV